jgi:5'-phosphate synthase pdxT subunit
VAGSAGSHGPRVGVLALQGDFREHIHLLGRLGVEAIPVRRESELDDIAGLVIPGGESSVMDKLSRAFGLADPLKAKITSGMPVFGTCAGLIMLADVVRDTISRQQTLGGLDIVVRRNAFGNQNDSFETDIDIPELGDTPVHAVFIRAPVVEEVGDGVTVLGTLDDGRVVAVEQGNLLGTAFHPEMTDEDRFHSHFLDMVRTA